MHAGRVHSLGMDLVTLTIRIDKALREQLDQIAHQDDRPVSYIVRSLLNEAIAARGGNQE